jgi:hypothetical protein
MKLKFIQIVDFFEIKPKKRPKHCHNKLLIPIYLFIYFQENCGLEFNKLMTCHYDDVMITTCL